MVMLFPDGGTRKEASKRYEGSGKHAMGLQNINRLTDTEQGDLLVLNLEALRRLETSYLKRNRGLAGIVRELIPADYIVIIPQQAVAREGLFRELEERGLDDQKVWVYGSVLPRRLLKRSLKIQLHPPLPGDEVPPWFDQTFPKRLTATVLPGYSCFTVDKLREAARKLLNTFARVRLKDPRGTSGYGQVVVETEEDLEAFLHKKLRDYRSKGGFEQLLGEYGYVVEANLVDVQTWSFTRTVMPCFSFTSLGRQVKTPVQGPDGAVMMEYGGTSTVTVAGGSERLYDRGFPRNVLVKDPLRDRSIRIHADGAVIRTAENHINALHTWEDEGIVRTRANIDVLKGMLAYQSGEKEAVTVSVEDSGRPGGASPAELLSALELAGSPEVVYAVRNTRHVFTETQGRVYRRHIEKTGEGRILWEGFDESRDGKYAMFCVF